MKNKTQRIQNIKTGELYTRYLNYEQNYACVMNKEKSSEYFYYNLDTLKVTKSRFSKEGASLSTETFNPKEWRKYKLDLSLVKRAAERLKIATGLDIINDDAETNGYGGYKNGENVILIDVWGSLKIICTCSNCGDGSWVMIKDRSVLYN